MERLKGIEPSSGAWKALILPLNYSRVTHGGDNENRTRVQTFSLWLYTPVEPFYPLGTAILDCWPAPVVASALATYHHARRILFNGASGWIRTNNVYHEGPNLQSGATPPSSPPTHIKLKWWKMRGSNPRPLPCKGSALPAELIPHYCGRDGVIWTLNILLPKQVRCQIAPRPDNKLVLPVGLEPTLFRLRVCCFSQLS